MVARLTHVAAAWNRVLNILLYPSAWLHEQTHYLALRPYAQATRRDHAPTQAAAALEVDVAAVPRWRYAFGAVAPTVVGVACALLAAVLVELGVVAASEPVVGWLVAGTYWFLYTLPSKQDVTEAAAAVTGIQGGSTR